MCGRYTSTAAFQELALRFGITVESGTNEELIARYNVAPSQEVPIIIASEKGRRLVMAKWGFRPPWIDGGKLAPINARAETVAMSRLFGAAVRDGRCLVPATGFYEWRLGSIQCRVLVDRDGTGALHASPPRLRSRRHRPI
jgi:putative SOS response-associated peptidase YedK